jgi:alpha-galactosidase
MSDHPRIVFIGGGSPAWLPGIGKDLLLAPEIVEPEVVLHDLDTRAARRVEAYLRLVAEARGARASITAVDDLEAALTGADYVVITITTGGLAAMAHDLAIPEEYGVYHTVGDTSGPGGWARLMRNAPVFHRLGEQVARLAPKALILNYSNPMTTLTQVLEHAHPGRVVGLCHGMFENRAYLRRLYSLAEHDLAMSYAGLNHFFWVTRARGVGELDLLADLGRRLATRGFGELHPDGYTDPAGHASGRYELATDLARRTGFMPYLGDRHTCEFIPHVIANREAMARYRLARTNTDQRTANQAAAVARLERIIASRELPPETARRSPETAVDIIAAHQLGRPFIDVGNLPNVGQVANLPRGLVVETPVCVDRNGFTPLLTGDLPAAVMALVAPPAHAMDLAVRAFLEQDRERAIAALAIDPLCHHLAQAKVAELGRRLLSAHASFLPAWLRPPLAASASR